MKTLLKILTSSAVMFGLMGSFVSCETCEKVTLLSGIYVQTSPEYADSSQIKINFIDNTRLEIIIQNTAEEFIYRIQEKTIKLTTVNHVPEVTDERYFRIINSRKFEIRNLNASVMIGLLTSNMIFEKQN